MYVVILYLNTRSFFVSKTQQFCLIDLIVHVASVGINLATRTYIG